MNKRNERPDEESPCKFSPKEFERRHRKIRELMQLRGIDCLVITGDSGGFSAPRQRISVTSPVCRLRCTTTGLI